MKKIIFSSMATVLLASGVLLYSCQKEKSPTSTTPTTVQTDPLDISVKDNRLVFKTVEDYEKAVDNPQVGVMNKVQEQIKGLAFTSLSRSQNSLKDSIKSDYFASILNEDLALQIGEHIYRVNPVTEKVYVLPVSKASEYTDLVAENESNENIAVYSTEEEVISLVNSGQSSQGNERRCRENGIGERHASDFVQGAALGTVASADYDKYGVYFNLLVSVGGGIPKETYQFDCQNIGLSPSYYYIHYKPKCKSSSDFGYFGFGNYFVNGIQKFHMYNSSRALNEVYLYCRIYNVLSKKYVSNMFGFRVNY